MESITVKTVLEYAVMPVQKYEFECQGCFMVKTIKDYSHYVRFSPMCKDCA
jgi:hypothetical protein